MRFCGAVCVKVASERADKVLEQRAAEASAAGTGEDGAGTKRKLKPLPRQAVADLLRSFGSFAQIQVHMGLDRRGGSHWAGGCDGVGQGQLRSVVIGWIRSPLPCFLVFFLCSDCVEQPVLLFHDLLSREAVLRSSGGGGHGLFIFEFP